MTDPAFRMGLIDEMRADGASVFFECAKGLEWCSVYPGTPIIESGPDATVALWAAYCTWARMFPSRVKTGMDKNEEGK